MLPSPAVHRAQAILSHLAPRSTSGVINTSTSYPGPHEFSLDPAGVLTPEQRRSYDENGYILIKGLVSEEDLSVWRDRFLSIATGAVRPTETMTMMRDVAIAKEKGMGEKAITKLQDWQDDAVLFTYCTHPGVRKYVQSIIGENFKSVHTMLINKPPDVGLGSSRHPPHQDLYYFPFRPAHRIVASWTAMQSVDRANGCLFVQPGTHRTPLRPHTYPHDGVVNKAYHGIHDLTEADGDNMLHVEMSPGDTIFFHPLVVHGSGRNLTTGYRKAISAHFASTDCEYGEMSGTIQADIAAEIEAMARRKGMPVSFNDVWRLKARLIQGKEGTL